eukprot:6173960-Pleurochrysis_carterae.AAC.4
MSQDNLTAWRKGEGKENRRRVYERPRNSMRVRTRMRACGCDERFRAAALARSRLRSLASELSAVIPMRDRGGFRTNLSILT